MLRFLVNSSHPGEAASLRQPERVWACAHISVNGMGCLGSLAPRCQSVLMLAPAAGFYQLLKRSPNPWAVTSGGSREPSLPHKVSLYIYPLNEPPPQLCGVGAAMTPIDK